LDIDAEVAALQQITTGEVRRRYAEVFDEEPRSRHKAYLIRKIAWRLQENAEGDLSERARPFAEIRQFAPANGWAVAPATKSRKTSCTRPITPAEQLHAVASCDLSHTLCSAGHYYARAIEDHRGDRRPRGSVRFAGDHKVELTESSKLRERLSPARRHCNPYVPALSVVCGISKAL
jgi:hypothetical protein